MTHDSGLPQYRPFSQLLSYVVLLLGQINTAALDLKNEFLKFMELDSCLLFSGVSKVRRSCKGWSQGLAL